MARDWKCARCSTPNSDAVLSCKACGLIRGSVVPSQPAQPPAPPPAQPPAPSWSNVQQQAAASAAEQPPLDEGASAIPPGPPPMFDQSSMLPDARPPGRRVPLRLLFFVAILVIGGISAWYSNASRAPSGEITKSGDMTTNDLRVGDCFDLQDPAASQVDKVTAIPCTSEHEYEMFFIGTMPEGDYPTDAAFQTFVQGTCLPAFDAYVGKSFTDSELDVFWMYPVNEAWTKGDRTVQCAVYHPRIHRLTESLKGSAR